MTSQLVTKLVNLAHQLKTNADTEIAAYSPKLHAVAADLEHTLEAWTSSVDHWVELHFTPEAEKLRQEAGALYRATVQKAHELLAEASAKTN